MFFIKKYILKIVQKEIKKNQTAIGDFWQTIQTKEGRWWEGKEDNTVGHCLIELQYNKFHNCYRIIGSGYKPTEHTGVYIPMAKACAELNAQDAEVKTSLEAVNQILNPKKQS